MMNNFIYRPRRKAWLGTAITTAISLGSSLLGASAKKRAQEEQYRLQAQAQARQTAYQSAQNLNQSYANAGDLNEEFQNRFLRYGGRRKAKWGTADTTALISALGNAGSNIGTAMIGQAVQQGFNPTAFKPLSIKTDDEAVYDSASRKNIFNNQPIVYRLGGCRRTRR